MKRINERQLRKKKKKADTEAMKKPKKKPAASSKRRGIDQQAATKPLKERQKNHGGTNKIKEIKLPRKS